MSICKMTKHRTKTGWNVRCTNHYGLIAWNVKDPEATFQHHLAREAIPAESRCDTDDCLEPAVGTLEFVSNIGEPIKLKLPLCAKDMAHREGNLNADKRAYTKTLFKAVA